MKGNLYTLCFACVLGSVCALLLTAADDFAEPYKSANAKAEEMLNVLSALKVPLEEGTSSMQLVKIFQNRIRQESRGQDEVYIYFSPESKDQIQALAIRFTGSGLWGPIKGFLALEPDMETIRGMTIFEQEETPGLGGEIGAQWFKDQFLGKSIKGDSGNIGIVIRSDGGKAPNGVDAITGATMTCDKLQAIINAAIMEMVKESE